LPEVSAEPVHQISTGVYQRRLNHLTIMTRSALVGIIHEKTLDSPSSFFDNGEAITLMSTDTDGLEDIATMFHETWAETFGLLIGIAQLAAEVGWIWPLPLVFIACKSSSSSALSQLPTRCFTYYYGFMGDSIFTRESLCGKTPPTSSKGMERGDAAPRGCYQLHAELDEARQDARLPGPSRPPHSGAS